MVAIAEQGEPAPCCGFHWLHLESLQQSWTLILWVRKQKFSEGRSFAQGLCESGIRIQGLVDRKPAWWILTWGCPGAAGGGSNWLFSSILGHVIYLRWRHFISCAFMKVALREGVRGQSSWRTSAFWEQISYTVLDLWRSNLQCFNFTMVQEQYSFSRNLTSNVDLFWGEWRVGMILCPEAGQLQRAAAGQPCDHEGK